MTDFENENEADWGEPTSSEALALEGSQAKSAAKGEWIKVDGTCHASWSGQSGCGSQSRVDAEWAKAFNAWTEAQKAAHPTLTFIYATHGQATGQSRQWDNWPNGRRCNGTLSGPASAYFEQPE